jgi:hypothetical protein
MWSHNKKQILNMEMLKKLLLFAIWVISNIHLVQAQVDNDRVLDVLSRQIAKFQDEKIKSMAERAGEELLGIDDFLGMLGFRLTISVAELFEVAASFGHELAADVAQPFESVIMGDMVGCSWGGFQEFQDAGICCGRYDRDAFRRFCFRRLPGFEPGGGFLRSGVPFCRPVSSGARITLGSLATTPG